MKRNPQRQKRELCYSRARPVWITSSPQKGTLLPTRPCICALAKTCQACLLSCGWVGWLVVFRDRQGSLAPVVPVKHRPSRHCTWRSTGPAVRHDEKAGSAVVRQPQRNIDWVLHPKGDLKPSRSRLSRDPGRGALGVSRRRRAYFGNY